MISNLSGSKASIHEQAQNDLLILSEQESASSKIIEESVTDDFNSFTDQLEAQLKTY